MAIELKERLKKARIKKEKTINNLGFNPILLTEIQPAGNVSFSDERYIKTGLGYSLCIEIYDFPGETQYFWLQRVMKNQDVVAIIDVATADEEEVIRNIDNSITELEVRYGDEVKPSDQSDTANEYHILKELLEQIKTDGEVVKQIRVRLWVSGNTKQDTDDKAEQLIQSLGTDYRAAVFLNENSYQYKGVFTPYSAQEKMDNQRKGTPMGALTLAAGYYFNDESLLDSTGMYLGQTMTGGSFVFDLFTKTKNRISYDISIFGKKGSGKSTLLKLLLKNNIIVGNYIRAIDITGEYTDLVYALNGKIISSDGTQGILNHLEVFRVSEDETINFAAHLSKLNVTYKFLSPSATEDDRNEFESYVRQLYIVKGLWYDDNQKKKITGLPPEQYPVYGDLLQLIRDDLYFDFDSKTVNQTLSDGKRERLERIELTLTNLINNYGKMFNGTTTMQDVTGEQLVIYNFQNAVNLKEEVFSALLFNVLSLMTNDMVTIGGKSKRMFEENIPIPEIPKILLIIDESHKIITPRNPMALKYLIDIVREDRKYFTGLCYASQSIRDHAPQGESKETGAFNEDLKTLFELTQYKFIMQQDANALPHLRNVFDGELTDSQFQKIPQLERGEAIFSISGVQSMQVKIEVTEKELALFKGGA